MGNTLSKAVANSSADDIERVLGGHCDKKEWDKFKRTCQWMEECKIISKQYDITKDEDCVKFQAEHPEIFNLLTEECVNRLELADRIRRIANEGIRDYDDHLLMEAIKRKEVDADPQIDDSIIRIAGYHRPEDRKKWPTFE